KNLLIIYNGSQNLIKEIHGYVYKKNIVILNLSNYENKLDEKEINDLISKKIDRFSHKLNDLHERLQSGDGYRATVLDEIPIDGIFISRLIPIVDVWFSTKEPQL